MNFTASIKNDACGQIINTVFSGENKKEEKAAASMNKFYDDIICAAMKVSQENGEKCYVNMSADTENDTVRVHLSVRLRKRGRTTLQYDDHRSWKNGVIMG